MNTRSFEVKLTRISGLDWSILPAQGEEVAPFERSINSTLCIQYVVWRWMARVIVMLKGVHSWFVKGIYQEEVLYLRGEKYEEAKRCKRASHVQEGADRPWQPNKANKTNKNDGNMVGRECRSHRGETKVDFTFAFIARTRISTCVLTRWWTSIHI